MIPKIQKLEILDNYVIKVSFDDRKTVFYDVKEDINDIPSYKDLVDIEGLFSSATLDESRTVISWRDDIDLPSDIIYEYGKPNLIS